MNHVLKIRQGKVKDAPEIARLIMTAMTDECCLYFCGEGHGHDDFKSLITKLASTTDTQYSYENTICCTDESDNIIGICVSYDGGELLRLRKAFIDGAKESLGKDNSGIPPESEAGELYIDSLAVLPEHRGKGIATKLLEATAEKCKSLGIRAVGLLVDVDNEKAERLYKRCGFEEVGTNDWGGHAMKHLQKRA